MSKSQQAIALLNRSNPSYQIEGLSGAHVYEAAAQRKLPKQLHSIFKKHATKEAKLNDGYNGRNIQKALDNIKGLSCEASLVQEMVNYRINFGQKCIFVDTIEGTSYFEAADKIAVSELEGFVVEPENFLDDEDPERASEPLTLVSIDKTSETTQYLFHEIVLATYYDSPDLAFLSEAGKKFHSQMRMKRNIALSGFHKIILDKKNGLRIILIDPSVLHTKEFRETPSDKAATLITNFENLMPSGKPSSEGIRSVRFFSAIQKLYNDASAGIVTGGFFYTSSGSRYLHSSKGASVDLRDDVFQKGGVQASPVTPSFVRLELAWPKEEGQPEASLIGSSEMLENPDLFLRWVTVLFSTQTSHQADFLGKVLEYGKWD